MIESEFSEIDLESSEIEYPENECEKSDFIEASHHVKDLMKNIREAHENIENKKISKEDHELLIDFNITQIFKFICEDGIILIEKSEDLKVCFINKLIEFINEYNQKNKKNMVTILTRYLENIKRY